jgi:hypothetical protein
MTMTPWPAAAEAETLTTDWQPATATAQSEQLHQKLTDALPSSEVANLPFLPTPLASLAETGLPMTAIEDMVGKWLLAQGELTCRELAQLMGLPFNVLEPLMLELKTRLLLAHKQAMPMGDFLYVLTDLGREKALVARNACAYVGALPVPLSCYVDAIKAQTLRTENPQVHDLQQAFSDLVLSEAMFNALGPAINAGKGLFLYGAPGNGKTSIAERVCRAYKGLVFIPQALWVDGEIILLYDSETHIRYGTRPEYHTLRLPSRYDKRWVAIERPVIVVGGELTMDGLELAYNPTQKVSEASLQLKANGGIFMIDDFGRQRVNPDELLNRWIVPLEKRVDYLTLANGKKIQVPFDEFIIFSTNLNPKDLVDEAFLRRIPYKLEVPDPTEETFRRLLNIMARKNGIQPDDDLFTYLIEHHYQAKHRPFRACQARDLLDQVVSLCRYKGEMPMLSQPYLDQACATYFAAVGG